MNKEEATLKEMYALTRGLWNEFTSPSPGEGATVFIDRKAFLCELYSRNVSYNVVTARLCDWFDRPGNPLSGQFDASKLEKSLRDSGYPIRIVDGQPIWTEEYSGVFTDRNLELQISIAPEVFGNLSREHISANKRLRDMVAAGNYSYLPPQPVSQLCLEDYGKRDCEDLRAVITPFYLMNQSATIADPYLARDLLIMLSHYASYDRHFQVENV